MTLTCVRFPLRLVLWLLLAMVIAVLAPQVADLPLLPRTQHAKNGHAQQIWDVSAIVQAMSGGGCGPVTTYICPDDTYIMTCADPQAAGRILGLVVGATSQQIITGYTARSEYWTGNINRCQPVGPGAMP